MSPPSVIDCMRGRPANIEVLLGFEPANVLNRLRFPDILDENCGDGYQWPFNKSHSLEFRRYIKITHSSTISFKLNLCQISISVGRVIALGECEVRLEFNACVEKFIAQVDYQHQVGRLGDFQVVLLFMCFTGYSVNEEMEVFRIINGEAKDISIILLDYNTAQLTESLLQKWPNLFTALNLNSSEGLPKFRWLSLSGKTILSLNRIMLLRMIQ